MGIGPSTKETSLHHFRDPLLEVVSEDTDLDLLGLIIVGTPDDNKDKMLVGTRAAAMAECMRADGVIISSDGWGNSDVDYTNTCEQLGIRGIPVTGLNFSGTVAKFVVVNDYLDGIIDINKSADGTETDVVGENNMVKVDCLKAKARREEFQYMSYRDMLTTLYNRNKYIQVVDSAQGKTVRRTGVAYIDINGLNQTNDSYGHEAGDKLIVNTG